jgi:hypothetical protein
MISLYYLLYKLKNDDKLWIVKTSDIISEELLEYTSEFKSDYEKYYLVKRQIKLKYKEKELKRNQFKIFKLNKNDSIISYSL